ncbi:chromosome segregation protein SMC [Piscirickettsia salmonis]|uniref:hypothetical protein n=1 Tax=Piscirickettsia salmonis TaxID=1238 RepID=UPI0012B7FAF9|nr:hypothetical protein [Piscirickettsia salmonis]QGP50713.1 chromosome segregation protein SMC [Piscirickettsia salmonis]
MGKELFSVSTDKVVEGALATSVVIGTVMYVKSKINKKKQEEATKILKIFNDTLGKAEFPKPFNLDHEDGEIRIPQELQEYTLEQIAHGNPYERTLCKVGSILASYNNKRAKTGDPIHSVLCYLHYILLSPSGLMGLTGKDDGDFEKLEMFASFLKGFAQMSGAKSRVSYIARILEVMPTQQQHGSQRSLGQKEPDLKKLFQKSENSYTTLEGLASSTNAEKDFEHLEKLSRRFADSTLRLATMGVTFQKTHSPLTTALLDDIAVGTVVPAVEKKGLFSIDEPAILLPDKDPFNFIKTVREVAASLEDFRNQSTTLLELDPDQLKKLITTETFESSEFNVTSYSRTDSGTTKKTPFTEETKLEVARGYVAILQLTQISADIARLAHYMTAHIRTESASSAAPFAFNTSDATIAARKRCYEMMAYLKNKADKIYQKNAQPLIDHLADVGQVDGLMSPQAAYTLADKVKKFKKGMDNAYKQIEKYNTLNQFEKSREQSHASIQKLEQEVSTVAQKYGVREKELTTLPSSIDCEKINAELTAHIQSLLKHFASKSFIPRAQRTFGSLVSCEDRQVTFDIQSDADLIRLEALAEDFIQQLESGDVAQKKPRPTTRPSAMLGSVSSPDLTFGYMPKTSEDPKVRAQRIRDLFREHTKGFRESTQRYAAEAKPREETKITAAATQEEIARLNAKIFGLETDNTRKQGVIDDTKKRLDESVSEVDQIQKSLGAQISEMQEDFDSRFGQMKEDLDEAQQKIKKTNDSLSSAQEDLEKTKAAHQRESDQVKRSFKYLESLVNAQSKKVSENNRKLKLDLNDLAHSIKEDSLFESLREKMMDHHQEETDFLKQLIVEFRAAAESCAKDSEDVRELIDKANGQVERAKETLEDVKQEIADLRQKVKETEEQANLRLKKMEESHKSEVDEFKATIKDLQDKLGLANQPKAEELQPKAEELQLKVADTTLSRGDNIKRTGDLFEIVVKALEKSEKNLAGTNKGKILELLRDDLKGLKDDLLSDIDFKVMLKQVLGVACQHRGSDGGFAKNATTTGNFVINLIEADSLIRAVIDPNNTTKKLDFERDILRGFLGVNDKKLRQDRTTTANLRNETKGNIFHAAFITDAGSVSRPGVPPVETPPVVAAAAG